jgi:hypothetical protein
VEHGFDWGEVYDDVRRFAAAAQTWWTPTLQAMYSSVSPSGDTYFYEQYRTHEDSMARHFIVHGVIDYRTQHGAVLRAADHPFLFDLAASAAAVRQAGGHVTLGAHGNYAGIGSHFELWALQMGGLTNLEALQAATILGAEGLGMQQDLGSIEVGKIADLVVLDKNPLEDIHNSRAIRYVMKDGELFDGATLDTRWPVAHRLPRWLYRDDGPPADGATH